MGTSDDVVQSLSNFTRRVQIQPLLDVNGNPIQTLNQVTVTIQYTSPNSSVPKNYVNSEYVSTYH